MNAARTGPIIEEARFDLVRHGEPCAAVHNNCSGKHAGMLALARQLKADPHGYVKLDHPVQQAIAQRIGEMCDIDLSQQPVGIDGCSVPTWAIPLKNLALGFARFSDPANNAAARRIIAAVRAHPFMVAGTDDFDTLIMQAVPRLFVKTGAEGVYCACIPHAGLGIALKIDDGAARAVGSRPSPRCSPASTCGRRTRRQHSNASATTTWPTGARSRWARCGGCGCKPTVT